MSEDYDNSIAFRSAVIHHAFISLIYFSQILAKHLLIIIQSFSSPFLSFLNQLLIQHQFPLTFFYSLKPLKFIALFTVFQLQFELLLDLFLNLYSIYSFNLLIHLNFQQSSLKYQFILPHNFNCSCFFIQFLKILQLVLCCFLYLKTHFLLQFLIFFISSINQANLPQNEQDFKN